MNHHRNSVRHGALRAAVAATLLGLLAACGGGGGNQIHADQPAATRPPVAPATARPQPTASRRGRTGRSR